MRTLLILIALGTVAAGLAGCETYRSTHYRTVYHRTRTRVARASLPPETYVVEETPPATDGPVDERAWIEENYVEDDGGVYREEYVVVDDPITYRVIEEDIWYDEPTIGWAFEYSYDSYDNHHYGYRDSYSYGGYGHDYGYRGHRYGGRRHHGSRSSNRHRDRNDRYSGTLRDTADRRRSIRKRTNEVKGAGSSGGFSRDERRSSRSPSRTTSTKRRDKRNVSPIRWNNDRRSSASSSRSSSRSKSRSPTRRSSSKKSSRASSKSSSKRFSPFKSSRSASSRKSRASSHKSVRSRSSKSKSSRSFGKRSSSKSSSSKRSSSKRSSGKRGFKNRH